MLSESRAKTRGDRCSHCGRPIGQEVEQCRPVRGGFYCWQRGYLIDMSQVVPYVPDPLNEREQAVVDEFAPKLAELEKRVDEHLAVFTTVEQSHRAALFAGAEIGIGPLLLPGRGTRPASARERKRAQALIDQLTQAREAAGARMQKARIKLHALQAQVDHRRRVARQPVIEEEE